MLRVAKLGFEPNSAPLGREKRWGGWESVLTKGQDLSLHWFSCLSFSYVACVAFGNLDTEHFGVQSVVLVGTIPVPPVHFVTFSHSSSGRVTTETPFDRLYLFSRFFKSSGAALSYLSSIYKAVWWLTVFLSWLYQTFNTEFPESFGFQMGERFMVRISG